MCFISSSPKTPKKCASVCGFTSSRCRAQSRGVSCWLRGCQYCSSGACAPVLPPAALSVVWSHFFTEVRHAEDNMTAQSHTWDPNWHLIESLIVILGQSGTTTPAGVPLNLLPFPLEVYYVSCMLSRLRRREIFGTKPLFATQSCLISLNSERK